MHEISRHAIHISEVLLVTIETLQKIEQQQKVIYGSLPLDPGKTCREQAQEYMSFQLQMMKSLQLRSSSIHERLKSETNVVIKFLNCFLSSTQALAIEAYKRRHTTRLSSSIAQ
jgi:hypothetical protein